MKQLGKVACFFVFVLISLCCIKEQTRAETEYGTFQACAIEENLTAIPNETVTMEVYAQTEEGHTLYYSWNDWQGIPIENENNNRYIVDAFSTSYSCDVSDDLGNSIRVYFHISAENSIRFEDGREHFIAAISGCTLDLEVHAECDYGELSYQWVRRKDGIDDTVIQAANQSILSEIYESNVDYYCWVSDQYGNIESCYYDVMAYNDYYNPTDYACYFIDSEGNRVNYLEVNNGNYGYFVAEETHVVIGVPGEGWSMHVADISNPSTCVIYSGTGIKATGMFDEEYDYYSSDGTVENAVSNGLHHAECMNPTKCTWCKQTNVNIAQIDHYEVDYGNYGQDATAHWNLCNRCGEKVNEQQHTASCSNPTVCNVCQAEHIQADNISHNINWELYDHDAYSHWNYCLDCNNIIGGKSNHYADCDSPDTCSRCGEKNIAIKEIIHDYSSNYQYDDYKHWLECVKCHSKNYFSHAAFCSNPVKCFVCGAESSAIMDILHENNTMISITEDGHVYYCDTCQTTSIREHNVADCTNNICITCGLPVENSKCFVEHFPLELTNIKDVSGHWLQCATCGYRCLESHTASCSSPHTCTKCGAEGDSYLFTIQHGPYQQVNGESICLGCGMGHIHDFSCINGGVCSSCGIRLSEVSGATIVHIGLEPYYGWSKYGHFQVCRACSNTLELESHEYINGICKVCGLESNVPEDIFEWTSENGQAAIINYYGTDNELRIPDKLDGLSVVSIESKAFMGNTNLKKVFIPESIKSIGTYAFRDCTSLQFVSLPDCLTNISNYAFSNCTSLKQIYLPLSLSNIANKVFLNSALETVICYATTFAHQWASKNNYRLVLIPSYTDTESIVIPSMIESIEEEAFMGIAAKRVVIPYGCTYIKNKAFAYCPDLEVLVIPSTVIIIEQDALLGSEGVMLIVKDGSYAMEWAEENNINYVPR